jgi:hypothetical protein
MWPLDEPDPGIGFQRPPPVVTEPYRAPRLCACGCGHEEGYHPLDEEAADET